MNFEMGLAFCMRDRGQSLTSDNQIIQSLARFSLDAGGKPVFSWITYLYN